MVITWWGRGARYLLPQQRGFDIVGTAADGTEASALAAELRPDVVLIDVLLPGMAGPEDTRRVLAACPTTRVVAYSGMVDAGHVVPMLDAGAIGYAEKGAAPAEAQEAVRRAAAGEKYLAPAIAARAPAGAAPAPEAEAAVPHLTARELEALRFLAQGFEVKEIAGLLRTSEKTVYTYLHRLYRKLGTDRPVLLAKWAARYGLMPPE
jgi:DNA-binding NarL/FixJ family response regulator